MGVDGLNEFVKHYYPQLNKKALIIDDRGNGGGNVSPMIDRTFDAIRLTFYTMHTEPNLRVGKSGWYVLGTESVAGKRVFRL